MENEELEVFTISTKYTQYSNYSDDNISFITKDKDIQLDQSQLNMTQEINSQYIPFEMPRYFDGIDLMDMTISIHFINRNNKELYSNVVNVSYSDTTIRFGWIIDEYVTNTDGDITFEIIAVGTIEDNKKYVWKTKPNGKINILKSLNATGVIKPSYNWYTTIINMMDAKLDDKLGELDEKLNDKIDTEITNAINSIPSWAKQPSPDNTLTQSGQAADAKAVGDILEKLCAKRYGMKINKNDSNPKTRCTYIFDAAGMTPARMNYTTGAFDFGDWGDVFFVKNNYPAMVLYDGTEDYKLDPNDHTLKADGTESDVSNVNYGGNAMSVFDGTVDGKIWLSQFEIGNYEYMIISNVQYDESYNDDAYVREDGSHAYKLYYPMFGGSYDGTRIRSLAGQTLMYNTSASTEITRAKANGSGWNIGSWSKRNLLNCMLKIMSKTDNSQEAFGQGQTTGYVDDESVNYGHLATGTLKDKGQFYGYNDTTHEVKVFFIEKWWGNRWDRINGLLVVGGEILAKMTPLYNLTGNGFDKVGIKFEGKSSGYQKATKSSKYGRLPASVGGSSSTYTCDYFWWNAGITAVALVCGSCADGRACGADGVILDASASVAVWCVGASVFLEQPV